MDTLAAMQVFVEVAQRQSFTAAAEHLGMSRSSVSKHVAFLEQHFSSRLLQRTTRRLSLTEAGHEMLAQAEIILDQFNQLEGAFQRAGQSPQGRLRLNAPYAFGTVYLGSVLAGYQQRYPDVELDVVLADRRVGLVEEGFDLALRIGELEDSTLVAKRLGMLGMTVVAAPAYIARHGAPAHPRELARHRCLTYSYARHGLEWPFWDGSHWLRVRTRQGLRANSGDVLRDVAIAGGGITIQPDFIVADALESGALTALLPGYSPPRLPLYAVYPERTLMPAKLRSVLDYLESAFDALRDDQTGLIRRPGKPGAPANRAGRT